MKKLKEKKAVLIRMFKVIASLLILWSIWGVIQLNKQLTIKDIAYDNILSVVNKFEGYTVYLKEKGEYEPFLVLSKNYNGDGDVLLLRKYLLDEPRIFNVDDGYGAYYENSEIDKFLNTKYQYYFDEQIKAKITMNDLEITARSSVGSVGEDTVTIPRKMFLLSYTEIAASNSGHAPKEGNKLLYFIAFHSYIAKKKTGSIEWYWLRTPYTEYGMTSWAINSKGETTYTEHFDLFEQSLKRLGVRPAFCVAKDTKLERKEGIVKGKKVFVLKEEIKN